MMDCFITFRSVTFAQRGESELKRVGISCNIQRTPRWMEEQGCGYSLRVQCRIFLWLWSCFGIGRCHFARCTSGGKMGPWRKRIYDLPGQRRNLLS